MPLRAVLSLCLVLVAGLTGCSSDPQLRPPAPAAASAAVPPPPVAADSAQVTITLTGGKVAGDTDVRVALNTRVLLSVTADVAGNVLVQPNGLSLPAKAGVPITAEFVADKPGPAQVTLDSGPLLATITVV